MIFRFPLFEVKKGVFCQQLHLTSQHGIFSFADINSSIMISPVDVFQKQFIKIILTPRNYGDPWDSALPYSRISVSDNGLE